MSGRFFLSGATPLFEGAAQPLSTLTFSLTGTSTAQDTYSDAGLTTANANPVVSDANGYFGEIFIKRERYKVIWKNSAGTTLKTWDPVDKDQVFTRGAGLPSDPHPGQKHANTSDGHTYEYKLDTAAWLDLGATDSISNAASVTDVLTGTSTSSLVTPDALAGLWETGSAVSIATNNISLPSTGGGVFTCSSASTTLTTISSAASGREVEIIFSNSQTITHGSGINTIGAVTYTIPAGARVRFRRGASSWTITHQCFPSSPGRKGHLATQYFTASGTYTRTSGCVWAFVRTQGPGGGGASSDTATGSNGSLGAGGGSGGYCEEWVQPAATETVTIGTGGASQTTAGTAGNNGSSASSFGSFHTASAGNGGATMTNGSTQTLSAGGSGGSASGGGLNIAGNHGGAGIRFSGTGGQGVPGHGASSVLGVGGPIAGQQSGATNGRAATGYGAGGAGGSSQTSGSGNGGAGGDGICIVEEYGMV